MFRTRAAVLFMSLALQGALPAAAADIFQHHAAGLYVVSEYDDGFGGNWDGDFPPYHPHATTGFAIVYQPEYSEAAHYGYSDPPRFNGPWHPPRIVRRKRHP